MKGLSVVSCLLSIAALAAVLLQERPEPVLIESQLIQERVIELPEDGGRFSFIAVYPDGDKDQVSRDLASALATTPRLQSLKAQTRFFEFKKSDYWPRSYLAATPAPFVILLDEHNKTIYHAYRGSLPADGESLADEIQRNIADCCPEVPDPQHEWQAKRRIPLLRPQSPIDDDNVSGLVAIAAAAAAAWAGWRSRQS